ncbi:MAG: hypothetical protein ACPG31_01040 [Planctomycetota bacterium]
MLMPLLLVGLLTQQPDASDPTPAPTPGLLRPLAVVNLPAPGQTARKLIDGPLVKRLLASNVLEQVLQEHAPGARSAVETGWLMFFKPLAGDVALFVDSFAGDGLRLLLLEGVVTDGVIGEPRWAVIADGFDAEIAMDCLSPALQMAGVARQSMRGDTWTATVAELHLMRQGDRFLLTQDPALLQALAEIDSSAWHPAPDTHAFASTPHADLQAWMSGELLRADGYPELPEDAGESYLTGGMHEVLRTADWIGARFTVDGQELRLDFAAPADPQIRKTHAPFFPAVEEVAMPQLERRMMQGVFTRDLAHWWAARSEYMNERGLAATIEGDSNLALLFGRDAGSEVFHHLENQILLLAAPLPPSESANLSVEYPAGAIGLQFKESAPEDLGQAFSNAFFAAITFANFEGGAMDQAALQMDILPVDGGRIYTATYPTLEEGRKASARYNFSPAMLVRDDGALWVSSSLGLLQEIAAAPTRAVTAQGMWMHFEFPEMLALAQRDRPLLVANRVLEEGGDVERAERFIDVILDGAAALGQASVHSFLDEDVFRLNLALDFLD